MSAWCQRLCSLATRSRTLAVSRLLVLSCSAPYTFLLYLDTRVSPASTWHVSTHWAQDSFWTWSGFLIFHSLSTSLLM